MQPIANFRQNLSFRGTILKVCVRNISTKLKAYQCKNSLRILMCKLSKFIQIYIVRLKLTKKIIIRTRLQSRQEITGAVFKQYQLTLSIISQERSKGLMCLTPSIFLSLSSGQMNMNTSTADQRTKSRTISFSCSMQFSANDMSRDTRWNSLCLNHKTSLQCLQQFKQMIQSTKIKQRSLKKGYKK